MGAFKLMRAAVYKIPAHETHESAFKLFSKNHKSKLATICEAHPILLANDEQPNTKLCRTWRVHLSSYFAGIWRPRHDTIRSFLWAKGDPWMDNRPRPGNLPPHTCTTIPIHACSSWSPSAADSGMATPLDGINPGARKQSGWPDRSILLLLNDNSCNHEE